MRRIWVVRVRVVWIVAWWGLGLGLGWGFGVRVEVERREEIHLVVARNLRCSGDGDEVVSWVEE